MPPSKLCRQITIDICIFIFFMCLPLLALFIWGQPATNGFWCYDQSLSFPYKPDTVSQNLLLLVGFGAPFFVMTVTEIMRAALKTKVPRRFRREMFCLAKAYGVFMFGVATNVMFTDTIKYSVGRLRPHFFDLCKPDFVKVNCTDNNIARYVSEYECTNTEVDHHLLRDSRLSFPSGHASLSIYSALFTVFYLQLRMKVSFSYLLRPVIQVFMVVAALFCCLTRITDHKHFLTDVLAGSILGMAVAWLSFYKLGHKLIPTPEPQQAPPSHIRRATSIESEPQTPTPLLRPERLVLSHNHLQHNGFRNGTGQATGKDQFGNV